MVAVGDALAALAIGIGVTLAAAIEPARRAGRVAPVEALKARLDLPSARRARLRWLVAVFAVVGVLGLVIWPRAAGEAALIRAFGVYAALLVVALAVPFVLPALARVAGAPFLVLSRLEERLARASVLRDRGRAALTVGALTIGLAMVVALGGVGQHARAAAAAWVADVVPGDLLVTSIFPRALDEGIDETLGGLPGVASVSPIATFDLAVDGRRVDGAAMVGADLAADGRLQLIAGDRATALAALDRGGAVIVPAGVAARDALAPGSTIRVAAADGTAVDLARRRHRRTDAARAIGRVAARRLARRRPPRGRRRRRVRRAVRRAAHRRSTRPPSPRRRARWPSSRCRSTGSRARSARPSTGCSACSTPWRSSRSSSPRSASSTRSR